MGTAESTIEYLPNDMYIVKGTNQPKRLSKFGIWWRDNRAGIFTTVSQQSSKSIKVCDI